MDRQAGTTTPPGNQKRTSATTIDCSWSKQMNFAALDCFRSSSFRVHVRLWGAGGLTFFRHSMFVSDDPVSARVGSVIPQPKQKSLTTSTQVGALRRERLQGTADLGCCGVLGGPGSSGGVDGGGESKKDPHSQSLMEVDARSVQILGSDWWGSPSASSLSSPKLKKDTCSRDAS